MKRFEIQVSIDFHCGYVIQSDNMDQAEKIARNHFKIELENSHQYEKPRTMIRELKLEESQE